MTGFLQIGNPFVAKSKYLVGFKVYVLFALSGKEERLLIFRRRIVILVLVGMRVKGVNQHVENLAIYGLLLGQFTPTGTIGSSVLRHRWLAFWRNLKYTLAFFDIRR